METKTDDERVQRLLMIPLKKRASHTMRQRARRRSLSSQDLIKSKWYLLSTKIYLQMSALKKNSLKWVRGDSEPFTKLFISRIDKYVCFPGPTWCHQYRLTSQVCSSSSSSCCLQLQTWQVKIESASCVIFFDFVFRAWFSESCKSPVRTPILINHVHRNLQEQQQQKSAAMYL